MGSNTTQRKAQAVILRAAVAEYREWRLIADCGACGPRSLPMRELPATASVFQILRRLRCQSCGGRVATAAIENDRPGWRHQVVKVWGPGSYG